MDNFKKKSAHQLLNGSTRGFAHRCSDEMVRTEGQNVNQTISMAKADMILIDKNDVQDRVFIPMP